MTDLMIVVMGRYSQHKQAVAPPFKHVSDMTSLMMTVMGGGGGEGEEGGDMRNTNRRWRPLLYFKVHVSDMARLI